VFALAVAITRRVSVGSIAAAIAVPFLLVFAGAGRPLVVAMAVVASLILMRHRENIGRLIDGTEPRIGRA
jgi:acyl phosphate:glycerol-3-phosphate acyltransferase